MAGQPPEPSFQPAEPSFRPTEQDQNVTQGRPAWQAPGYTPPPAGGAGQPGYGAPAYGAPDQGYAAPPPQDRGYAGPDQQGYAGPDQQGYGAAEQTFVGSPDQQPYAAPEQPGYAGQDQSYPGQGTGQGYPGYQPQGYAQPGQQGSSVPPPQWQAAPGATPTAPPKARGEKGFLGSLFDFSFNSFVTPKIIKVLYVLFTIWTALIAISILVIGFKTGGVAGGLFTLIIIEPIFVLLALGIYRVVLEAFMVLFRIYEETKKIRENSPGQS